MISVEVFPRSDGSTHITALSDVVPLPIDPAAVKPGFSGHRSPAGHRRTIVAGLPSRKNYCPASLFPAGHTRRLTADRQSPRGDGLYVATGHNVWGILNSPATGEAIAELIAEGAAQSIDLAPFDPMRLPALDLSLLRTN